MSNTEINYPQEQISWLLDDPEVCDLRALKTAEDRLSFLIEREPRTGRLPLSARDESSRIQGCLSGLWITSEMRGDRLYFCSASDSEVVGGVAGLLCDLFSDRTPSECLAVSDEVIAYIGIESLLSLNRRHAVSRIVAFVRLAAKNG